MYTISELFNVESQVVIVTGGGSGIGKGIAAGFAENGAKVYIVGRRLNMLETAAEEIRGASKAKCEIKCIQGDVGSKDGCLAVMEEFAKQESYLDTLVNCAGVQVPWKEMIDPRDPEQVVRQMSSVEEDDFNYTNQINVNGVFFMTSAAISSLRASKIPSVINIGSILGVGNSRVSGTLTYSVSKAAAIHLSKMLAGKLSPLGIRINTICPGIFPSEMSGSSAAGLMMSSAEKTVRRTPLGRAGKPEEIIGPVLMLSSRAGGYFAGSILAVDGGRLLNLGNDDGVGINSDLLLYP